MLIIAFKIKEGISMKFIIMISSVFLTTIAFSNDFNTVEKVGHLYNLLKKQKGVYELSAPRDLSESEFSSIINDYEFCQKEYEFEDALGKVSFGSDIESAISSLKEDSELKGFRACYSQDYAGYWMEFQMYFSNNQALSFNYHNY